MAYKNLMAGMLLLTVCMITNVHASDPIQLQEQQVETLVREAVDMIKAKGEIVFPEFRKKGSKWFKGERYIFVFDEKGLELVNGAFPEIENRNLWDHQDSSGRFVVREEVALVKAKGPGWIVLPWPKPGQTQAVKCKSYLQGVTIGGRLLIVGMPLYQLEVDREKGNPAGNSKTCRRKILSSPFENNLPAFQRAENANF